MSLNLKSQQIGDHTIKNITKSIKSQVMNCKKSKSHKIWTVIFFLNVWKSEMSHKMKYKKIWNGTKAEIYPKY